MSDPFWDELGRSLPRPRRGEAGWSRRRAEILSSVRGEARAPRRVAAGLAAGLAMTVVAFAVLRRPLPQDPPAAAVPAEELDLLEAAPMLDHLDELLDATELDPA
ncbi:MAG: hypothetical protein SF051_10305 [Elusimicrobiota bacterium]|nr:hypothetical protein [Elusimicrobiota bacterium]